MNNVVRLPVRRLGKFEIEDETLHATVGGFKIIYARLVTTLHPETWCVLIRGDEIGDILLGSTNEGNREEIFRTMEGLAELTRLSILISRCYPGILMQNDGTTTDLDF